MGARDIGSPQTVKGTQVQPDQIERMFTRDGGYAFARWGRPIAPVVFGVDDASLAMIKAGVEAIVLHAGHQMAETDPELGVNLMVFFCQEWAELSEVPDLDQMIPELGALVPRLQQAKAQQYRLFRFDESGAIKACFVFVRMDAAMSNLPVQVIALDQAVRSILLWGDSAFETHPPLEDSKDGAILRADIARLVRAAYDPMMPAVAQDPSHALRMFARMEVMT